MKKILKLVIALITISYGIFPNVVFGNIYTKLEIGYGKFDKYTQSETVLKGTAPKSSPIFGGEIGYCFDENIRVGINVNAFTNKYNRKFEIANTNPRLDDIPLAARRHYAEANTQVKTLAALTNVYYGMNYNDYFRPYVMVGAGVAKHSTSKVYSRVVAVNLYNNVPNAKNYSFAWNVGMGTQLKVDDKISLDLGVKYIDYGKATAKTVDEGKLTTRIKGAAFMVGIVYNF